jgi:hypothetical protein
MRPHDLAAKARKKREIPADTKGFSTPDLIEARALLDELRA